MMSVLMLVLGGGLGAVLRYEITRACSRVAPQQEFPLGTLCVNILGSLGLGIFLALRYDHIPDAPYSDPIFLLFAVGLFGALTTFSTFCTELHTMLTQRRRVAVAVYAVATLGGSITALITGLHLFEWFGI